MKRKPPAPRPVVTPEDAALFRESIGEVRVLAQRSATAAKEISDLISDSVSKVDTGTRLVAQAGATMEDIVKSIQRVTGIVAEITSASTDQAAGIQQVGDAVGHMPCRHMLPRRFAVHFLIVKKYICTVGL